MFNTPRRGQAGHRATVDGLVAGNRELRSRPPQIMRNQLSQRGSYMMSRARMYFQTPYF